MQQEVEQIRIKIMSLWAEKVDNCFLTEALNSFHTSHQTSNFLLCP